MKNVFILRHKTIFDSCSTYQTISWKVVNNFIVIKRFCTCVYCISGDIPLHLTIREMSDKGQPIVISYPDSLEVSTSLYIVAFSSIVTVDLLFFVS